MSRVANMPVELPKGVEAKLNADKLVVKGPKGEMNHVVPSVVNIDIKDNVLSFAINGEAVKTDAGRGSNINPSAMAGTTRALVSNIVQGVSAGFEKKLELVGVGYRAQMKGKVLNLSLGFSHPVDHAVPDGITITTPSQTEVVVQGIDKQKVGQVAADIRAYRPPEPYKGKGIRYADEVIVRKETKKK